MDNNLNKLRPLFVAKILMEHTDEDHLMNIAEILQRLHDEHGIDSYRATIAKDIELLQESGMDIEFVKKSQNWYHYLGRDFDVAELKILISAVESARFISKDKSAQLVAKISKLAGPFAAETLKSNIDVEHRIKPGNEQILYIVDAINEAINRGKQIRFKYFEYDATKARKVRFNGYDYKLSPYRLVWNGDYYYVIGFNEKYQSISSYRIDRMASLPEISDLDAVSLPRNIDLDEYLNTMFRMFNAERKKVTLICDNSVMGAIIDRFGEDVETYAYDMENFKAEVTVACGTVFYSWVFGFCGKVKIKEPEDVKQAYANMLNMAFEAIKSKAT